MHKMESKKIIQAAVAVVVVLAFMMPVSAMIANKDNVQTQPSISYTTGGYVGTSWIITETSEFEGNDIPQGDDEGNFLICPTICHGSWEFRDWRIRLIGTYTRDYFIYDGRHHQMNAFRHIIFYWQSGHTEWIDQYRQWDWDGFRIPVYQGLMVHHRIADPVNFPLDYITIEGWKTVDGVTKSYYREFHDEPFGNMMV